MGIIGVYAKNRSHSLQLHSFITALFVWVGNLCGGGATEGQPMKE
jgi:hypothetical protein